MESYQKAVEFLFDLQWIGRKFSLENIISLMEACQNPHRQYKTVHIAGTNGKGSTAAFLSNLLQEHGYRVGLYTSPHLIDFNERIQVNRQPVAHETVARLVHSLLEQIPAPLRNEITFFEFTTAMAFRYFAEEKVDFAVIEVGMGGRLDATNVVLPEVSVITNVGFDHELYLGDSLEKITFEKAGIIKTGIPTVTAATQSDVLLAIERVCLDRGSRLYQLGRDFEVKGDSPQHFSYRGKKYFWPSLSHNLLGNHQILNAACALSAMEILSDEKVRISERAIYEGLKKTGWPGRLEPIKTNGEPLILLDGAHNPAGAKALGGFLSEFMAERTGRLFLILGIMRDKNIKAILGELIPLAHTVILTRPDYHRAASLEDLEAVARSLGAPVRLCARVTEALALARSEAEPTDCICVSGSLFTAGEARAAVLRMGEPSVLKG